MSAHPNKGDYWIGNPKPVVDVPKDSWWTRPAIQRDRAAFHDALVQEVPRINSHPQFGGAKKIHDSGLTEF